MKMTMELVEWETHWQCDIRSIETGCGGAGGWLGRGVGQSPAESVNDALRVAKLTNPGFASLFEYDRRNR